jgi:hypothetical protein
MAVEYLANVIFSLHFTLFLFLLINHKFFSGFFEMYLLFCINLFQFLVSQL